MVMSTTLDTTSTDCRPISLSELAVGQSARILSTAQCPLKYRKKLARWGIFPDAILKLVRKAPLGDPLILRVHGHQVSLRCREAKDIQLVTVHE